MPGRFLCLGFLTLGCNALLGITDTSPRGDGGSAGLGSVSSNTAGPCATNDECLAQTGETDPSACVGGRCVKLITPECPLLLPQTERLWLTNLRHSEPDPVIFGAYASIQTQGMGTDARNYDLVLTEVTHSASGIPAADGKRHPVLAVVCRNQHMTTEELDHSIDHLAAELQVPGILAGLEARDTEYAFRRQGLAHHVFFMSPLDADTALVDLVDDGLVWEMLSGGEDLAPAYAPLLDRALAYIRGNGRLGADEPARVALVTTDNVSALSSLSNALTGGILQINGVPARESSADYFRAVTIPSWDLATAAPDYTDALRLLEEFQPHVVIGIASSEFVTTMIPALEGEAPELRPFYLLSPWHVEKSLMQALLSALPGVYQRVAGVNYAAAEDTTIYDEYQARFDAAYPALAGTHGYENYYDAGYYMLHAAAAAGTATPLVGSDLVNGMRRLLAGRDRFTVGPDDLSSVFTALAAAGSTIQLDGAMGPPNFDPKTGGRHEPGSVWCVDRSKNVHTDVLRLDADGNLSGDFPCFDFPAP